MHEQITYIDTMLLDPPKNDVREERDAEYIRWLAEDIKARGLQHPIRVRPPVNGRYEVLTGETRRQAHLVGAISKAMCVIVERELTESELLLDRFLENEARNDMNEIERARCYLQMQKLNGWNQDQIARAVGKPAGTVSKTLALLDLSPELQEYVITGRLAPTAGYALARLKDQPDKQKELAARFIQGLLTRDSLSAQVSLLLNGRRTKSKAVKIRTGQGIQCVIPELDCDVVLSELYAVAEGVKKLQRYGLPLASLANVLRGN